MGTVPVSRENSGVGGMKKRGIWVKVKPAVGLYHLRFDVSHFTDESRADLTPFSDKGTEQTIEVEYSDDDKIIWSRYRATPSDVVPMFSRMSHPGYMFRALPIAVFFALLMFGVGRLVRKRFSSPTAEPHSP
jgi:hypothetical protein